MFETECGGPGDEAGDEAAHRAAQLPDDHGLLDATARRLEALPGGIELARELFALDVADVSDQALIEVIAGFERVASAAVARQNHALSELLARRGSSSRAFDAVVDELRARLSITGRAAETKVGLAAACESYPEVADALAVGPIDVRRATVLTERQPGVSETEHRELTRDLLDGDAEERTAPQLKADVRRHALTVSPEAGALRREAEYAARHVEVEPLADAMARVTAYLRADDARTVKSCLDRLADAARTDTDTRTVDQRRADVFVGLFSGAHEAGTDAGRTAASGGAGRSARAQVHVTIGADTLLGLDDEPAEMDGYGPIPADLARRIAQDATWRGLFTDANGEFVALGTKAYRPGVVLSRTVRARDVRCTFPGCRQPAVFCDLDHLDAYDATDADARVQTTEVNLHPLCRRHHNLKTRGIWTVRREDPGRTWIAPTAHRYTRRPDPPLGTRRRKGAPRGRTGGGPEPRADADDTGPAR
ncbi:HNH endonuclease signature motif containing protein [Georgenia alba]|uniref:DUF222 domain-containing protein n=1 Tax=Georgenia alba TaxID=2233858 RepID=A0ABW2Q4T8_9MICO